MTPTARRDWTPAALHALSLEGRRHDSMESLLREGLRLAPPGLMAEFGVHEGGTLRWMAATTPGREWLGFDSFRGLPEAWNADNPKGKFDMGGRLPGGFTPNITLVPGWFEDTLPGRDWPGGLAFAHVDCDLGSSAKTVMTHAGPHLAPRAVLNFHEFWYFPGQEEGEALALAEWLNATGRAVAPVGWCGEQYGQASFVVYE